MQPRTRGGASCTGCLARFTRDPLWHQAFPLIAALGTHPAIIISANATSAIPRMPPRSN
ncbi:hypothetical protein [Haloferula sp. BvORR071]|uniref:hypothetical protein n=1 Tax=Haloferula sp. BvORR071 TaxID=1396141 RepID=UPI002240EF43|nr:hypothetical protein [Haloferula sp. BvORR071]